MNIANRQWLLSALSVSLFALALAAGCRREYQPSDALRAFMGRVSAGDEVGARAFWAWDFPLTSTEGAGIYGRLVTALTKARQRVGWEQHEAFYYVDAAFSQPTESVRRAQVAQVEATLYVIGPGQSRVEQRLAFLLARVSGAPQGWRIFGVRIGQAALARFVGEIEAASGSPAGGSSR